MPILTYIYIAVGVVILSLSTALYVQTLRLEVVESRYAAYAAGAVAIGKLAIKDKELKEFNYDTLKKDADNGNINNRNKLRALTQRLQSLDPNSSILPKDTRKTGGTEAVSICFDRDELDRAQSESEREAEAIAIRGSEVVIDLQTAVEWSCELSNYERLTNGSK